ncbi:MAG: hypothetical protein IKF98_09935, partial [Clostridia bacterium]|nr:hypothetical protein [Clostridia bacterium]
PQICLKSQAISGRQICKEAFFALVDRLPAAKKAPPAAYTPPRTIKDWGATAPDTPGKLAKGEFVISSTNQN